MSVFSVGQTVYCSEHGTKYEVQGYWSDYIVVIGPRKYPCLRKREELTSIRPAYIKVRKRTGGPIFLKRLRTMDDIQVGEILVDLTFNTLFEVVEVGCAVKSSAQIMEAYRLGEKV